MWGLRLKFYVVSFLFFVSQQGLYTASTYVNVETEIRIWEPGDREVNG
jgi:hypothetical protein